jgi:hypothetical protein
VQQRADLFVENRFAELDAMARQKTRKIESIAEFLARGGTINKIRKEIIRMADTPIISTQKMTAREAADMVINNPTCTIEEIMAVIPEYKAPLPRRSWIAKFKSIIDQPQFADLK